MVMKWDIMRKQEIDKMNGVPIPMTVREEGSTVGAVGVPYGLLYESEGSTV